MLPEGLLTKAAGYVLTILAKNEEVQKFPKEFIDESVKWVKSWFLKPEEPTTTAILEDKTKPEAVKKVLVETQLQTLSSNPEFMTQLQSMLEQYAMHRSSLNLMEDVEIKVKKDFHQGSTGGEGGDNIIKRAKIEVEGDFRQGNDFNKP